MNEIEKIQDFLTQHLHDLEYGDGGGVTPQVPNFDLYAYDYLEFASRELGFFTETNSNLHLLNCISQLKRALDCQIDTFLYCFNLYKLFSSKNLKFDKKMDFLKAAGVYDSRTLSRLNTMRNRMEHSYEIPQTNVIEIYYDLVAGFIAVLERTILFLRNSEATFYSTESLISEEDKKKYKFFSIEYILETPKVIIEYHIQDKTEKIEKDTSNIQEFAYLLKIFMLLCKRDSFASDSYIIRQIKIADIDNGL